MTLRKKLLETIKSIKMLKRQSGSVLIISALMLPLMLGCLGFAYDFGNLYMHKARLQNMTDAAALAGGYAFLESRKKPQDRDTVDDSEVNLMGRAEVTYKKGMEVTLRNSNHPDADKAADDYIMKNIDNLGTTVKSDRFSHYALKSKGAMSTSTELSGDISHIGHPRTFYRIGLYEDVPLHFLPVILNKKVQKVRAGTVVLVDDGKGYAVGKSLFDNLFTVGEEGITVSPGVVYDGENSIYDKPSDGGAVIQATFDGDIVIATDKNNWNSTNKGDHFYTEEEKSFQLDDGEGHSIDDMNTNYPNMGGKAVRDNSLGIDSSVSGFLSKLEKQHFDLKRTNTKDKKINPIVASKLNNELQTKDSMDSYLKNHHTITTTTPATPTTPEKTEVHYFHVVTGGKITYNDGVEQIPYQLVSCVPRNEEGCRGKAYELVRRETDRYYSLLSEGYKFKYKNDKGQLKDETCYTYVVDNKGNKIFCKYTTKDDSWKFYRKNVTVHEDSTREIEYQQLYSLHNLNEFNLLPAEQALYRKWSYNYNGEPCEFTIEKETVDYPARSVQVNEPQITNSNIFHWENDGWKSAENDIPLTLEVDSVAGSDYYPLYIILTGNEGTPISIKVKESNVRPIIFCNLTTNEITFNIVGNPDEPVSFKGMIYSPFAKVVNAPLAGGSTGGGKFKGNIVAKGLDIQDSSITWVHQNFLENDSDLNTVSENVALAQEQRKTLAEAKAKEYLSAKLIENDPDLNIDIYDVWNKPEWFSSLTDDSVKNLIKRLWSEVRQQLWQGTDEEANESKGLDMPDWPWKDGGKTTNLDNHHYTISENDSSSVGEKVRIINFRTEYTTDPYIDPFTDLYMLDD